MKRGILGGTFDPPHLGHLHIAVKARDVLKLEEVLFVPARRNPMKRRRIQATPLQRFELCQELIAGEPGLAVSDIELTRGGLSYSVDTLEELQRSEPGNYWLILGADAVVTLPDWKSTERILKLARIAVFARDELAVETILHRLPASYAEHLDFIPAPEMKVSSSKIREAAFKREPWEHWVTEGVANYIKRSELYR